MINTHRISLNRRSSEPGTDNAPKKILAATNHRLEPGPRSGAGSRQVGRCGCWRCRVLSAVDLGFEPIRQMPLCGSAVRQCPARSTAAPTVRSSLNAWFHSLRLKPGMSHSMHSGSMARAASAVPKSAVSQPNWSRISDTTVFASRIVAANEHRRPALGKLRVHHQGVADRIEGLYEMDVGKGDLQALHQRLIEGGESFYPPRSPRPL